MLSSNSLLSHTIAPVPPLIQILVAWLPRQQKQRENDSIVQPNVLLLCRGRQLICCVVCFLLSRQTASASNLLILDLLVFSSCLGVNHHWPYLTAIRKHTVIQSWPLALCSVIRQVLLVLLTFYRFSSIASCYYAKLGETLPASYKMQTAKQVLRCASVFSFFLTLF